MLKKRPIKEGLSKFRKHIRVEWTRRVLLGFICERMASLKKCWLAQQTAHYIMLFFNYAQCTFWKVVNNRTVQFKWVAGVQEAERRLEFLGGDDKPDTRPVNRLGLM